MNPKMIIPVFQSLNGDGVFGETGRTKAQIWFNGIGFSFAIGMYLK